MKFSAAPMCLLAAGVVQLALQVHFNEIDYKFIGSYLCHFCLISLYIYFISLILKKKKYSFLQTLRPRDEILWYPSMTDVSGYEEHELVGVVSAINSLHARYPTYDQDYVQRKYESMHYMCVGLIPAVPPTDLRFNSAELIATANTLGVLDASNIARDNNPNNASNNHIVMIKYQGISLVRCMQLHLLFMKILLAQIVA